MYLSVSCVLFPRHFASHSLQLRRIEYFPFDLMVFFAQFNVELLQNRHSRKTSRDIIYLSKSLIRVANLIVLKCFHLLSIRCEVFGQSGFLTELDGEVLTNVAEVLEQKRLFFVFQHYLVTLSEVLSH